MPSKTYNLEGIGEVKFSKYKQSKNIRLSMNADGNIKVSLPYRATYQEGIDFVFSKETWIQKTQKKIKVLASKKIIFTLDSEFQTYFRKLILIPENRTDAEVSIEKEHIIVAFPENEDIEADWIQDFIKEGITDALRIEAKYYLPIRVKELAKQHGFSHQQIRVKNAKTRWGSCSGVNNINLNIHLMRLPSDLVDYVILHELCHTIHKNHGKEFWNLLEKVCHNSQILDNELKKYSTSF